MTTYNTGNALGSSDARDLYDNAENIDNFANGAANTYQDRLGVTRKSLAGMNNAFDDFIESSGYTVPVAYTSGIVLTEYNQLIEYNDEFYKLKAGQAPYTTIGTWGADSAKLVSVGDAALRQELAAADGADRVGYGAGTVQDALDARLPEVANYAAVRAGLGGLTAIYVRGRSHIFDGGAGIFRLKAGDTTTEDNGGTVLVDSVSGARYFREVTGYVSVLWWEGVDNSGSSDSYQAMNAARNYIVATKQKLVFPAGIYSYSSSPNWAIDNATVVADGTVRLRYTGTDKAVVIDADAVDAVTTTPGLCYNLTMGNFIVESPLASDGIYVRSVHHSRIAFNCRAAINVGLRVKFAVCTHFSYTCSVNEGGWYNGVRPNAGMSLEIRNPGETVSYCYFENPVIEGPVVGISLLGTLGNVFSGGTSEACADYGVFAASSARFDRFIGTDFEANGIADAYLLGVGIELINCDTEKLIAVGGSAKRCSVVGGGHESVVIEAGAEDCTLKDFAYNRILTGGTVVDAGYRTEISNVKNASTGVAYLSGSAFQPSVSVANGASAVITVPVAGARLGDFVLVSSTANLSGLSVSAQVSSDNTVVVSLINNISGASVSLPDMTVRVKLSRGV